MTALRDKIAVEPLDADRVARLERNLMTAYAELSPSVQAPRRSRLKPVLVTATAALVAAAALALVWLRGTRAELTSQVQAPTRVATGDTPSRLELADSAIDVGAHTTLDLFKDVSGTLVVLRTGRVDCEVEPLADRAPFVVRAANVKVTVVGTVFSVERHGDDVKVAVRRGKVRVERQAGDAEVVFVAAREQWDATSGKTTTVAAAPTKTAAPTTAADDDHPALGKRNARTPRVAKRRAPRRHVGKRRAPRQPKKRQTDETKQLTLPTAGLPMPMAGTAAELERRRYGDSANAERAAYSAAYRHWQQGRRRRALKSLKYYLDRYNSGKHREGALWLKIKILCAKTVGARCRTTAYTYLREFPAGHFAEQATQLTTQ